MLQNMHCDGIISATSFEFCKFWGIKLTIGIIVEALVQNTRELIESNQKLTK